MRRINTPDGLYHDENPLTGTPGTVVKAAPLNSLQEEVVTVIHAAGFEIDPESNRQLLEAIQAITGGSRMTWGAIDGKPPLSLEGHKHDASDVTSGVLVTERIPELPISRILSLADALNSKAPKASPALNGTVTVKSGGGEPAKLCVYDANGVNAVVELGVGYTGPTDGNGYIANRNVNGFLELFALNGASKLRVQTGGCAWNGYTMWHSGNFNPDTKVNINASTSGSIRLVGNGAYYFPDRITGRDWAWYASGDVVNLWNGSGAPVTFTASGVVGCAGISCSGTITTSVLSASSSDETLKEAIDDLRDCLATVKALRPRRWRWVESGEEDFGFIAQEHRGPMPGAVYEDEKGMLYVRYGKAEALLVGAVHELDSRLQRIEIRLGLVES